MIKAMSGSSGSMTVRALTRVDISGAERAFSVANTPLFLLRNLKIDPATAEIARNATGHTVLQALKQMCERRPRTLDAAVRPYVYLVALSMMPDISFLREAANVTMPYHRWFRYLAEFLVREYRPTSFTTVSIAPSPGFTVGQLG
jgi:hypothetical protein